MSAETRGAEKGTFSELQRKSNFLSSQRNASATQMHTASSSQSKTKKQCPFAAQPNEVIFVDYLPGETYEVSTLQLSLMTMLFSCYRPF